MPDPDVNIPVWAYVPPAAPRICQRAVAPAHVLTGFPTNAHRLKYNTGSHNEH